jgi:peroxiredoxin
MKTLISIFLVAIFPLLAMSQAQNHQLSKLKTLEGKTVDLRAIFQEHNLTIVYFFKENCRNVTDQLEYLENLAEKYQDINLKIVAVCNASNSCSGLIQPFINGNDIGIETFIDVNGELQQAMGLPVNSNVILTRYTNSLSGSYVQSVSYSPEQADVELLQLLSCDTHNSDTHPFLSNL